MEETALLGAVQRIVGGVQSEHDLRRGRGMGVEEHLAERIAFEQAQTPAGRTAEVLRG
jgi:hypothetical protein